MSDQVPACVDGILKHALLQMTDQAVTVARSAPQLAFELCAPFAFAVLNSSRSPL